MNEIDYAELDKEVNKAMKPEPKAKKPVAKKEPVVVPMRPRGRYMDMVHPSSDMRPSAQRVPLQTYDIGRESAEDPEQVESGEVLEFGVIEDVVIEQAAPQAELQAEADFISEPEALQEIRYEEEDDAPDANNYSLGGTSPFIIDAKVEKRPLGDFIPENSARGVYSTRNVYSQRTPIKQEHIEIQQMVIGTQKKKSGWIWALATLGIIVIGGGLGLLIYLVYTS